MAALLLLLLGALLAPSAARPPPASASAAPTVLEVRVGAVLPENSRHFLWARRRVAPALSLALEALQPQLRLDGLAVRTAFAALEEEDGTCEEEDVSALKALQLRCSHDPDVLLGMVCYDRSYGLAPFSRYWRLPILLAGLYPMLGVLDEEEVYLGPLGPSVVAFQKTLLQHFKWTSPAVTVFIRNWECERYYALVSEDRGRPLGLRFHDYEEPGEAVRFIQAKGRVAFICVPMEEWYQIMRLAHAQNMTNGDYVFIHMDLYGESLRAEGHREAAKPWQSKESQDTGGLREAFQTVLVITAHEPQTPEYRHFENQLVLRAQRDFGVAINDSRGHLVAGCFHDGLLLYLRALNETLQEGGTKRDTSRILQKMKSLKIQGVTGTVSINSNSFREMDFDLWAMRDVETGEFQVVCHYIASEERSNWTGPILWKKGGPPPDNTPCVFDQDDPSSFERSTLFELELLPSFHIFWDATNRMEQPQRALYQLFGNQKHLPV